MSHKTELVNEFRGVVESVIADQVESAQSGIIKHEWLGMNKEARTAGLVFEHVNESDGRTSVLGLSRGEIWGVRPENRYVYAKHVGFVAIVSRSNEPETLFRRWSIDSGMQMFDVTSERPLEQEYEIQSALDWARSPHLNKPAFGELVAITEGEEEAIAPQLEKYAEIRHNLNRDLEDIARAHRRPPPNIIIG